MSKLRSRSAKAIIGALALTASGATAGALVVGTGPASAATSRCGPGYVADGSVPITDSKGKAVATLVVAWSKAQQANCAVLVKKDTTKRSAMSLSMHDADTKVAPRVGALPTRDAGNFQHYAGPVYAKSPGCLVVDYKLDDVTAKGATFEGKWGCKAGLPNIPKDPGNPIPNIPKDPGNPIPNIPKDPGNPLPAAGSAMPSTD